MVYKKLIKMEPGLIGLNYFFKDNPQEELALIMSTSLAYSVALPNNVLNYGYFLRFSMKSAVRGLGAIGPFSGHEIHDEHIESVDGRVIKLGPSFCDFEKNYNPLLIPGNSPFFQDAINEMKRTFLGEGFNIDVSNWWEYKDWEIEKLKEFSKR